MRALSITHVSLELFFVTASNTLPVSLGVLKNRLNLEYVASLDASSRHRALYIFNVDTDLSGNYTCTVSTVESEDQMTKTMFVLGKFTFVIPIFNYLFKIPIKR